MKHDLRKCHAIVYSFYLVIVYKRTIIGTYIQAYIRTCIQSQTQILSNVRTYIHTHTRTHTHTHCVRTYTYIHTCAEFLTSEKSLIPNSVSPSARMIPSLSTRVKSFNFSEIIFSKNREFNTSICFCIILLEQS